MIISAAALKSHSVVTNIERMILMYWRQKNRPAWLTFFVTSPWSWLGVQDAAGFGKKNGCAVHFNVWDRPQFVQYILNFDEFW